ncbi:MAG: hypothetical protein HOJ22_02005 [Chloroflexi bacterium]|jgi:hypothetical protein|nr:hypothetical protein [Chloroflexota bacterium]MBT5627038.1 hypothetical protein [Chloroflexota bacterium]
MIFKLRTLTFLLIIAIATMAPVCVLSGGETTEISSSTELSSGALVEVIGDSAEVKISRSSTSSLELKITSHNSEFVDFYTQSLAGSPSTHFVISATTSADAIVKANSTIELAIPAGVQLAVRTTNRGITVDSVDLISASLETTDGKISVTNSSGDFDLDTTNFEVTVQAVDGYVNIATTNAHVWFDGVVDEGTNSISTTNGDISLRLRSGSNVLATGSTHNGEVTIDGGSDGVTKDGDTATLEHLVNDGQATLNISNGPGAIHINPDTIAVFDGDS